MKYISSFRRLTRMRKLSALLSGAVLLWAVGFPFAFNTASAASLTFVSDTISNSAPSQVSNHLISYYSSSTVAAGQTIRVTFDPLTDAFTMGSVVIGDLSTTGFTTVAACGGGASEATFTTNANPDYIEWTVCAGDTVPVGTTTIAVNNGKITNPAGIGSYVIRIGGSQPDGADTRVAIVNQVTVTAAVDTSLTFTITGVAIGLTLNGDATTTATTTTATSIPFGTLASGTPKVAAQDLSVATNARNGFIVTIIQNQNLLSNTGADIDLFKDGNANVTPTAWTAPLSTLGSENTYGHYGVTSEDSDLNGDEFGTALYAGNFGTTSRVVFSHNGPADGTTVNIGATRVGFKIQVGALQEAANDYTNKITYVCTPTF